MDPGFNMFSRVIILAVGLFLTSYVMSQDTDVCSPARVGGPVCTCNATAYNCSGRSLTEVPVTYTYDVTELDLSHNQIQEINNSGFITSNYGARSMIYLYLHNNRISLIQNKAFITMMKLKQLFLNNNQLESINAGTFEHLAALEVLDLSNNRITTLSRYSFFTNANLYLVFFNNNLLQCDCETRLLREFLQQRRTLTIDDAHCANFNNNSLMGVPLTDFPACPTGDVLFDESTCYVCSDTASLSECSRSAQTTCTFPKAVCYTQVDYNSGDLGIWGGCIDYDTCILREKINPRDCVNQRLTSCYFCSRGDLPNADREMRTTKEFETQALITLGTDMTSVLTDTTSSAYQSFTWNLATEVSNYLTGQKGAFLVEFTGLRLPRVTMAFNINCSTIWYNGKNAVMDEMRTRLLDTRFNGFIVEDVSVTEITMFNCAADLYTDARFGTFNWPATVPGAIAIVNCPFQLSAATVKQASRLWSDGSVTWGTPQMSDCAFANEIDRQIQELATKQITEANAAAVSSNISSLTESWQTLQSDTLDLVTDVVEGILTTDVSMTSHPTVTDTLGTINNVMFIDNNILERSEELSKTSSRILKSLDNLLEGVDVSRSQYQEVKDNVGGHVSPVTPASYTGVSFSIQNRPDASLTQADVKFAEGDNDVDTGRSGIVLPSSLFTELGATSASKVSMVIIRDSKLFQSIVRENMTREVVLDDGSRATMSRGVNSYVMGASIPGKIVANLNSPVKITFQHLQNGRNASCVYWDDQTDRWQGQGCTLYSSSASSTECHCLHLTNFALLMDVYGTGGGLSEADRMALAIISYVGCGVSLIAVILTLTTYLAFKKLRRDNPSKILMNLCLAIGLADFVFLAGMQDYTSNNLTGCKMVAMLLHFFLLSAMCWMAVEAFYMYMALVRVFDSHVERFQLKSSLFGWALPLVIVVCTIAINKTDNYGIQPGGICWLDQNAFYGAFLGPVCLILIANVVVFVLVLRQIFRRSSNKLSKTERNNTSVRLRGAISLIILLGLTWLFAIFAVDNYGLVFHYLFAIFNSLQGFFIFIFYCFLKKEAQQSWRSCLPCLKSPYEPDKSSKGFTSTLSNTRTNKLRQQDMSEINSATASTTISSDSASANPEKATAFRGRWQFAVKDKA